MGAIVGTLGDKTEFSGEYKLLYITAPVAASSDTITLTAAAHAGASSIVGVVGGITGGLDAAFSYIQVSFSGLVITVASFEQDGTVATDFTGTTVGLYVLVKTAA